MADSCARGPWFGISQLGKSEKIHQEQLEIIENFELRLRTSKGDDPLGPWYDYVVWLAQSFPESCHEVNLHNVLEKCLAKFNDVSRYKQDIRYVKLWIKYINICVDVSRTELYQIAYNHGVGTQSALFYRFWAYEYEKFRDFKMAEQIYEKGLAHNAQPAEELLKAQTNFMKTITRMSLHGDLRSPQRPDMGMPDHRHVLNTLRPHSHNSHLVRNVRVGSNVLRSEPKASLVASNTNCGPQAKLRIFSDYNDSTMEPNVGPNQMHALPRPTVMNKENSLKAGPRSGPAGRRKPKPSPASFVPDRPTFLVYTDKCFPESRGAQPTCNVANALKPIKRDVDATPCYLAEPYDPAKRPMYSKHLVYDGGVEFSLEELRAARYLKKERDRGELRPKMSSIPFVPSPVKSPSIPEDDERELEEILQPPTSIPFVPILEQIPEEPEASNLTCVTQAFTQAFHFPLMSSTPFHGNMPPPTDENEYTSLYFQTPKQSNDGGAETAIALKSQKPVAAQTTDLQGPINLSIIMKDSKELNYKSSSSSGSSNAATRLTFSHSDLWSRDSSTPEYTNKSEFRDRDSLATIRKNDCRKNADSDKESSSGESPTSKMKTQMKAKVFSLCSSPVVSSAEKQIPKGKVPGCDKFFNAEKFESEKFSTNVLESSRHEEMKLVSRIRDIQLKNLSCHDSSFASAEIDLHSVRHRKESIPQLRANPASLIFEEEATHFSSEYISKNTLLETELHELSAQLYRSNISSCNQSEPCQEVDINDPNCSKLFSTKDTSKIQDLSSLKSGNTSVASSYIHPNQNDLDPFDVTLIVKLLDRLNYPGKMEKRYLEVEQKLPTFKPGSKVEIANESWQVLNVLGKGAYAKVYKVSITEGETTYQKALKVQKPSWVWELYISTEIHRRLRDISQDTAFMDITKCYGFGNGSVMVSDFLQYGTLLHAADKLRYPTKLFRLVQPLSMFWTIEMLRIMEQLHACQIIHGDVKPDNFLLLSLPSSDMSKPSLQLIDFGRSIDLSLFPRGTTFNRVVSTQDFTCVEMQTGRPWTYQTDLYGLASSVHCILFGEYMKVTCVDGKWRLQKRFSRNHMVELWDHFFTEMLNIESCSKMPDLANIRRQFEEAFEKNVDSRILNTFSNIMLGH